MADLSELVGARREKLRRLKERGVVPFAWGYSPTHRLEAVHRDFAGTAETEDPREVRVCGRLVSWRDHGKSAFGHIEDATGRLQFYAKKDALGDAAWAALADLDVGDFLGVQGRIFRTRTGELTVRMEEATLLAKSLRPLPEKWHGLKDTNIRYRHRHLDLASSPEARTMFRTRSGVISGIRRFLDDRGYMEVETPSLQPLYGGAEATPFTTRYESLDTTYYLRISDELYLKRLLVGGLDRVYEICKDYRNEGLDRTHAPEFTMIEFYQAYADYNEMMAMVEELFRTVVTQVKGEPRLTYQGRQLDFSGPWPRISFVPTLAAKLGYNPLKAADADLRKSAEDARIPDAGRLPRTKLIDKLFTTLVRDLTDGPAFVIDHPMELSPLAKVHRSDPRLVERFQPVAAGLELGNSFSELNDPDEQRRRFEAQQALKAGGLSEAQVLDEEFLAVMEVGMPPAGGVGLGIDRLVMLLSDATAIREVILYPQLKPEAGGGTE